MIVLENVSKQYRGMTVNNDTGVYLWIKNAIRLTSNKAAPLLAIDNVSFSVNRGEIFGIYGSNGAGKTTLIKLLSGLLHPTGGTVAVDGMTDSKHIKNTVSYISTNGWMGLEWQLTARENLLLYGNMFGLSGKALERVCDEVLQTVGMSEAKVKDKYISQLSAGMRQKITIARGLILNRPIIFYDEPSVSLDVQSARNLRELIRADASQSKRTAIIASHNPEDLSVCGRILMLSHGKIVAAGTPGELAAPLKGTRIIEIKMPRQNCEIRSVRGVENITYGDVDGKRDIQSVKVRAKAADFDLNELIDFLIGNNIAVLSIKDIDISLHEIYEYHLARNGGEAEHAV